MACMPFKQYMIRNTRGIECHQERPDRFNFLNCKKEQIYHH
jgi:hypothetical protein